MNIRVLANILRIIVFREKHPRQFVAMKHVINASTRGVNPIGAGGGAESAHTFFKHPFLHEKRGLEVPNFVTFPNSL